MASQFLTENRAGRNSQHPLVPLVRQSVYIRLAGYPDTNDADRLAHDPAMPLVVNPGRDGGRRRRRMREIAGQVRAFEEGYGVLSRAI